MATPDVELAKALVADINDTSRNWSVDFQAERSYKPLWIGKDELGEFQCLVNPWPVVESETKTRTASRDFYEMDFGFAKRLKRDDKAIEEIDSLRIVVDAVRTRYMSYDVSVSNVGRFIPQRRTEEYVTFHPASLARGVTDGRTHYTGDFLSMFRIRYEFFPTP